MRKLQAPSSAARAAKKPSQASGSDSAAGTPRKSPEEDRGRVEAWMRGRLSQWEVSEPLAMLGLDSLDLVQLRNAFNKHFRKEGLLKLEIPLSVFSNANQTLSALMDNVSAMVTAGH